MKKFLIPFLCILAGLAGLRAQSPSGPGVRFSVNRQTMSLSDTLNITIVVHLEPEEPDPVPFFPEIPGFTQVDMGKSVINSTWGGTPLREIRLVCSYLPRESGQFAIPPIRVRAGGRETVSKAMKVSVLNPDGTESKVMKTAPAQAPVTGPPSPLHDPGVIDMSSGEVKLITDVSKMSPWQGEQVVVTYAIQTSLPLESRAEQRREPDYSGFLKKIVPVDPTKEMARVETARGAVWIVPIARIVLFPLRSGVLPIEPVEWSVKIRPSGASAPAEKVLASDKLQLNVRPLPGGAPAKNLDVGTFSIQINCSSAEVKVGEAFSLYLTIRGMGNLFTLSQPVIPPCPGFKLVSCREKKLVFEPFERLSAQGPAFYGGEKVWEIVLYPKKEGKLVFPGLTFVYFDSALNTTRSLQTQPIPLTAGPPRPRNGNEKPASGLTLFAKIFYGLLIVLLLATTGFLVVQHFRKTGESKEKKKGVENVDSLLEEAAGLLKNTSSIAFFDILHSAVVRKAEQATGLSIQEMRRDEMIDALSRAGVSEEEVREIIRLLEDSEEARFAGIRLPVPRRREMLENVRRLCESLGRLNFHQDEGV